MSEKFNHKLKAARAASKLSQSKMAIRLGVPVRTLQEWEQGRHEPRGFALTALHERLDKLAQDEK